MKHVILILYIASWLSVFGAGMLGPIYAVYVESIGGDLIDAGLAWAIFSLVMGVLTIIAGEFENKYFDRRKAVIGGYFIIALATIGYLFVETPLHLFGVQFLLGIGAAVNYPAWDVLFSHAVRKDRETIRWAGQEGGVQIVAGIAAIGGGLIAQTYGFKPLFIIMLAVHILSIITAIHLLKRRHQHLKRARG